MSEYRKPSNIETNIDSARIVENPPFNTLDRPENSKIGIALYDSEDKFVFANDEYHSLLSLITDQLKPGITFEKILRTVVERDPAQEAVGREEEYIQECLVIHQSGNGVFDSWRRDKWFRSENQKMPDGSLLVQYSEVTNLKAAAEASRQNEAQLHAIVSNTAEAIITTNSKGEISKFNPAAEKMFGYTHDEILGQNISILVQNDLREKHKEYVENSHMHAPRILDSTRQLYGQTKSGQSLPIEITVSPMTVDDNKMFVGVIRDITERQQAEFNVQQLNKELESRVEERTLELKNSEDRFRLFAQTTADQYWETNVNHEYIYRSEDGGKLDIPISNLLGRPIWDLDKNDVNLKADWANVKKVFKSKQAFRNLPVEVHLKNGEILHTRLAATPKFDSEGKFDGYCGTTRDETAEIIAQENVAKPKIVFLKQCII